VILIPSSLAERQHQHELGGSKLQLLPSPVFPGEPLVVEAVELRQLLSSGLWLWFCPLLGNESWSLQSGRDAMKVKGAEGDKEKT
jgi:hypothetical protein